MLLPFDNNEIEQRLIRFKIYLDKIINCPTITFEELIKENIRKRGLYLIFEKDELVYIGMTENTNERFRHLTTSYKKHTFNQKKLAEHLRGKNILRKSGDAIHIINDKIRIELFQDGIITLEQFKKFRREVNENIKKFSFKFFETKLFDLKDFEHFAIAILNPLYND